jgi:exodeoxyribonuclease-3
MQIATWNINGLRARLDFILHWLRSREPDIVGLQELKITEDLFPYSVFEEEGYYAVNNTQKAWNGVSILSRAEPQTIRVGLPGQEDQGARLIAASVDGISFITAYCPNGKSVEHPDFKRKLEWFDSLAHELDQNYAPTDSVVLCGDFNICPSHLDSWNEPELKGRIFHTDEERLRLQRLIDWGLYDLYRELVPQGQDFSWWDYRAGAFYKNQGLRIDLVLASKPIRERVTKVEIDREYRKKKDGLTASDHAPVIVHLEP